MASEKRPALLHCNIAFLFLSCWTKWKEPTMAQGWIRQSPPYAPPYGHSTSIPFAVSQDRNSNSNSFVYTYCLQLSLEIETAQRQLQRWLLRSVGQLQWEKVGPWLSPSIFPPTHLLLLPILPLLLQRWCNPFFFFSCDLFLTLASNSSLFLP